MRVSLVTLLAISLAGCTGEEVRDSAARTSLAVARAACHAADNCGVSCPDGTSLDEPTLACRATPR